MAGTQWRGGRRFTVIDGSQVELGGGGPVDTATPWNCLFTATVHGVRQAFTVTERGAADALMARLRHRGLRRWEYRGAEVVAAYSPADVMSLMAWRGRWHEVITEKNGPVPAAAAITRILDAFRLTDGAEGLLMRPRSERQVTFDRLTLYKEIPGLGDLRIERPHGAEPAIPSWGGARSKHGEIWRRGLAGGEAGRARAQSLVLATPTAVTELIPGPEDTGDDAAALAFLDGLDVRWMEAS